MCNKKAGINSACNYEISVGFALKKTGLIVLVITNLLWDLPSTQYCENIYNSNKSRTQVNCPGKIHSCFYVILLL